MKRAVAASLFPELVPDKAIGYIPPSVIGGTNADLIATIAPIYLTEGPIVDVTYGLGGWWQRFRPDDLICHDVDREKGDGVDCRRLPEADGSMRVVCLDLPYIPAGGARASGRTKAELRFVQSFGIGIDQGHIANRAELLALIEASAKECRRVVRPDGYVLAKCTDYVDGSRFRLGHLDMISAFTAIGMHVHDLIVHHTGSGPGGHNIFDVLRARRHHSYLLVFTTEPR